MKRLNVNQKLVLPAIDEKLEQDTRLNSPCGTDNTTYIQDMLGEGNIERGVLSPGDIKLMDSTYGKYSRTKIRSPKSNTKVVSTKKGISPAKNVKKKRKFRDFSLDEQHEEKDEKTNKDNKFTLPAIRLDSMKTTQGQGHSQGQSEGQRLAKSLNTFSIQEDNESIKSEHSNASLGSLTFQEKHMNKSKDRDKKRKAILNREGVTVYHRNAAGEVVPSGTNFKRNVFAPPDDREKKMRKKMILAEISVAEQQRNRVNAFFNHLEQKGNRVGIIYLAGVGETNQQRIWAPYD